MNARARITDRTAILIIRGLGLILVALLAWIIVFLLINGWQELHRAGFYTTAPNIGGPGSGVGPQLFNTFYVLVLSMVLTVPVALLAGIYFAEYAGTGALTNIVRRATETLATLPSIIVGLFGFALFVEATHSHPSRLAASLALLVINLPYGIRVTEDSLRALPNNLREGSLALGATRWQTVTRVLLPAALPGLITGVIDTLTPYEGEVRNKAGQSYLLRICPYVTVNNTIDGASIMLLDIDVNRRKMQRA